MSVRSATTGFPLPTVATMPWIAYGCLQVSKGARCYISFSLLSVNPVCAEKQCCALVWNAKFVEAAPYGRARLCFVVQHLRNRVQLPPDINDPRTCCSSSLPHSSRARLCAADRRQAAQRQCRHGASSVHGCRWLHQPAIRRGDLAVPALITAHLARAYVEAIVMRCQDGMTGSLIK